MPEPVVFVNPGSGSGTEVAELAGIFPGCRIEPCPPDQLAACVRKEVDAGAAFVGVAGGDGTLRTAVEVLVGSEVALLAVPEGTRNHFAKDFGIASPADAGAAATAGDERRIDVGRVNDRFFLNNASIGAYPRMVERREEHEARWPKRIANVIAAWQQARHGDRLRVLVDDEPFIAWLVFVGNGRYGDNLRDLTTREALDANVLDVRIIHADRRFARLRLLGSILFGRLARTPTVTRRECRQVTMAVPRHSEIAVALDGEVVQMTTPLEFESMPSALRVRTSGSAGGSAVSSD